VNKPHKHAEIIKAWADGAEIQWRDIFDGKWFDVGSPTWKEDIEYRIKPENELIAANKTFDIHFRCYTNTTGKIVKVEVI
jgi:hypothetical protein